MVRRVEEVFDDCFIFKGTWQMDMLGWLKGQETQCLRFTIVNLAAKSGSDP